MERKKLKIEIFNPNLDSINILIGSWEELTEIQEVKDYYRRKIIPGTSLSETFTSDNKGKLVIWVLINKDTHSRFAKLDELLIHESQHVINILSDKYQITDYETKAYIMMYLWKKTKNLVIK